MLLVLSVLDRGIFSDSSHSQSFLPGNKQYNIRTVMNCYHLGEIHWRVTPPYSGGGSLDLTHGKGADSITFRKKLHVQTKKKSRLGNLITFLIFIQQCSQSFPSVSHSLQSSWRDDIVIIWLQSISYIADMIKSICAQVNSLSADTPFWKKL